MFSTILSSGLYFCSFNSKYFCLCFSFETDKLEMVFIVFVAVQPVNEVQSNYYVVILYTLVFSD